VKLNDPIDGCDYVNASWIRRDEAIEEMPTFIAAQGPMEHTRPHFLQMIMENKIKVIVMLTPLVENTKNGMRSVVLKGELELFNI
jgi:protein tyrosine phosphatase